MSFHTEGSPIKSLLLFLTGICKDQSVRVKHSQLHKLYWSVKCCFGSEQPTTGNKKENPPLWTVQVVLYLIPLTDRSTHSPPAIHICIWTTFFYTFYGRACICQRFFFFLYKLHIWVSVTTATVMLSDSLPVIHQVSFPASNSDWMLLHHFSW